MEYNECNNITDEVHDDELQKVNEDLSMNTKPLPNYMYIGASLILFILLVLESYYMETVSTVVPVLCYAAVTLINVVAAIFIKNYMIDESAVVEVLEAIIIPGFLYFMYSFVNDKTAVYIAIIIIIVGTIVYISGLIKVNILDAGEKLKSQCTKEIVAIGLYNARSYTLTFLSVFAVTGALLISANAINEERLDREIRWEKNISEQSLVEWSESRTLAAHYDEIKPLASDKEFEKVTNPDERLALFERAVDITANYLHVPNTIFVTKDNLKEGINANFSMYKNLITIDEDYLALCSRNDLLKTCIHECTHALQAEKIKLYRELDDNKKAMIMLSDYFANVEEYKDNLASYKGEGEEYYTQTLEQEAIQNSKKLLYKWDMAFSRIELEREAAEIDN